MKTMTCKQLGGACEMAFHAETFEEMAELSKQHGIEMYQQQDQALIAKAGAWGISQPAAGSRLIKVWAFQRGPDDT